MLSSPNSLATLTGARNHIALWLGASAFTNLDADLQAFVNDAFEKALDRVSREGTFRFLLREAQISTVAPYTTGTVSVTAGDATVTGVGTAFTTSSNVLKHDKFVLGTTGAYRVLSVTDGTNLELFSEWAGTTAATQTYAIGRDEYPMAAGLLWLTRLWGIETADVITLITPEEWTRLTGGRYTTGKPTHACLVGADPSDASNYAGGTGTAQRIQFYPVPDARYAFAYSYKTMPTWPGTTFESFSVMDLVLAAALRQVFWRMGDESNADRWEAEYQRLLVQTRTQEIHRTVRARVIAKSRWRRGGNSYPNLPDTIPDPN